MGRRSIFGKPMTAAERQRRHREKKYAARAERASPDQSIAAWFETHRVRPGDLVPFDAKDFEPAELEPCDPNAEE